MTRYRYFQERAQSEPAVECFKASQECLEILRKNLVESGGASDNVALVSRIEFLLAETYRNLGCSAAEINDSEATISNLQKYNAMMRNEFAEKEPDTDPRLAISYFDLALGYTMAGRYEEAVSCNVTALEEAQRLKSPDQAKATSSLPLTNLACTYWLMGRSEEADTILKTALKAREDLFGVNDRKSMV